MSVIRYRSRTVATPLAMTIEASVAVLVAALLAIFGNWVLALVAFVACLAFRVPVLMKARQPQ